jgi:imidazolonepropionase-like amidohydrolase
MKHSVFAMLLCLAFIGTIIAQPTSTYIKAGNIIDTETGTVRKNQIIVISNDTIAAIGAAIAIPSGAKVIDLSNATVLPGLIDCHVHITGAPPTDWYGTIFRNTPVDAAITAHKWAKATLDAGFTACRDLGSTGFVSVSLRNAIERNDIPGPRLQVATFYIGSTGSHGDLNGFSPHLQWNNPEHMNGVADGVDGVRKQVRYNIKYGADVIKFGASAGVLSEEESVGAPQYTQEEMNAIVDEANMWGKKTAAHAHGTLAIKMAVKAGVASIEHGSLIDDEGINMMKEHGTYLVADIYNDDYILSEFAKLGAPEKIINKEKLVGKLQRDNFSKAVKAGVKVAFGTDAGVFPHGWNAKQFSFMVKYGLTPMQAIQAATINAADLMGMKEKIGSIRVGKYADIIAVSANPLENISVLENVRFVMKAGVVYKNMIQ